MLHLREQSDFYMSHGLKKEKCHGVIIKTEKYQDFYQTFESK